MQTPHLSSIPSPFSTSHLSQQLTPTTSYQRQPSSSVGNDHSDRSGSIGLPHAVEGTDRARAYKSRNKRPCDFCRYKKAACHLETSPPCELCIRYGKECTFVESPAKRRRPNESQNGAGDTTFRGSKGSAFDQKHEMGLGPMSSMENAMDMQQELLSWETTMPAFQLSSVQMGARGAGDFAPFDPALYTDTAMHAYDSGFNPMSASTTMAPLDSQLQLGMDHHPGSGTSQSSPTAALNLSLPFERSSGEPSLDLQASSNAQIVGLSGESDPYLLSRYRYDENNEATFQSARMRKMDAGTTFDYPVSPELVENEASQVPAFFTIQHNALASKAQPPERVETIQRYRREVEEMVSDEVGTRLIQLFFKYIQPYFPVLSRDQYRPTEHVHSTAAAAAAEPCKPSHIPTSILAAIYGHALPFCAWDEKLCVQVFTPPSADSLFRIAWLACLADLHTPNLAVLQTLLLLVQRRPTNKHVSDTPFKWVMMSTAVSIAQTLGINRDPGSWPLPTWEITLRRRLGWATFVQEKWLALNTGRSSHINSEDWDIEKPTIQDIEQGDLQKSPVSGDDSTMNGNVARQPGSSADDGGSDDNDEDDDDGYSHFTELCDLSLIIDDILRKLFSIRAARQLQSSLEATLEVAKPLRLRLTEWYQRIPPGHFPIQPSYELLNNGAVNGAVAAERDSRRIRSMRKSSSLQPHELDGDGSLHLAYITAKIELFRAMLRPRVTDGTAIAVSALRTGAMSVAKEVFEFLEGLGARELEAFWASYSRANFTICSSFILLLYVTAPTLPDARECLALVNSWRALLRIKSRSCDLLNLALLRLDGVFVAGVENLIEMSPAAEQAWKEANGIRGASESESPQSRGRRDSDG